MALTTRIVRRPVPGRPAQGLAHPWMTRADGQLQTTLETRSSSRVSRGVRDIRVAQAGSTLTFPVRH